VPTLIISGSEDDISLNLADEMAVLTAAIKTYCASGYYGRGSFLS
jgi:hypothetical protein